MSACRQPKPVKVTLEGEISDVQHYLQRIMTLSHSSLDQYIIGPGVAEQDKPYRKELTIFPRAVND